MRFSCSNAVITIYLMTWLGAKQGMQKVAKGQAGVCQRRGRKEEENRGGRSLQCETRSRRGEIFKVSWNEVGGNTSQADIVKKKKTQKKKKKKASMRLVEGHWSPPPSLPPSLSILPSLCQFSPSSSQWERLRLLQPPST